MSLRISSTEDILVINSLIDCLLPQFILTCNILNSHILNYYLYNSDITVELEKNKVDVHFNNSESFKVTLVDTGLTTNTAGRIKKIQKYVENETFMLTYGDGVSDINIKDLIAFHKSHGKMATLTNVQTPGRFGNIEIDLKGIVDHFVEKPQGDGMWINGGFFVLEPEIFNYLQGDVENIQWKNQPLFEIANNKQLAAYKHQGFWKPMDALRDRIELEQMWQNNAAKWKIWG